MNQGENQLIHLSDDESEESLGMEDKTEQTSIDEKSIISRLHHSTLYRPKFKKQQAKKIKSAIIIQRAYRKKLARKVLEKQKVHQKNLEKNVAQI